MSSKSKSISWDSPFNVSFKSYTVPFSDHFIQKFEHVFLLLKLYLPYCLGSEAHVNYFLFLINLGIFTSYTDLLDLESSNRLRGWQKDPLRTSRGSRAHTLGFRGSRAQTWQHWTSFFDRKRWSRHTCTVRRVKWRTQISPTCEKVVHVRSKLYSHWRSIASKKSYMELGRGQSLFNSRKVESYFSRVVLDLNKLCPRPNSLYAFFEATDLQWEV